MYGPRDSTSLRTFEFSQQRAADGQRGYLIVICCKLACSFNGIEIELADFGVGIVEIQGVFWVTTMSCSSGTSLKAGYYFHDFSCESHTEPSPMEGKMA